MRNRRDDLLLIVYKNRDMPGVVEHHHKCKWVKETLRLIEVIRASAISRL